MHILYIASVRIPNEKASGLAVMRQCEAFADLGNVVTLLRPFRKNHIIEDPFEFYGIEKKLNLVTMKSVDFVDIFLNVGFYLTRLSQMIYSFIYILQHRKQIDIVYARDPWMLFLPTFLLNNIRIVWEAHQVQKSWFVHFVANRVYLLVCITHGLKEEYEKWREKKIIVEPSGVHIMQFENLPPIVEVRKQFNIPFDKKVIGYIGKYTTMGEEKGVDELIKAFASVYNDSVGIHLLIVGLEDSEMMLVEDICKTNGLPKGSYTLLSLIQKDFALYVHMADILVMNYPDTEHYRTYMSPTKLFAYMASNKIVIASDLPSVREIVDESMVMFVLPNTIAQLATAIQNAVNISPESMQLIKSVAYKRVQSFSWKLRAIRILDIISST